MIVLDSKQITKGSKMATPKIGETIKTAKSGVVGVVKSVDKNANGSLRVLLDVNGTDRWTTIVKR